MSGRILLGHGSGGRLTQALVRDAFLPAFANPALAPLSDAAILPELPAGRPALTTDGFVVDPTVFPGGDLGYLAVCGTVNDLAVSGARPVALTFAVILEEGLETERLATFVESAARAAAEAGVPIVAGDTKVVPRGKGDGAYATTSGLGIVPPGRELGDARIRPGDVVIATGPLGDHGATIMALRHDLSGKDLRSDVAPLASLAEAALAAVAPGGIRAMHDPTRGGLATTCNEAASRAGLRFVLDEAAIPVRPQVRTVCDLLGLDPLYVACEGRILVWAAPEAAGPLLDALRAHPQGAGAAVIGRVEPPRPGGSAVVLRTSVGAERPLDLLSGADLPRIC